jgi:hypothetical protein
MIQNAIDDPSLDGLLSAAIAASRHESGDERIDEHAIDDSSLHRDDSR